MHPMSVHHNHESVHRMTVITVDRGHTIADTLHRSDSSSHRFSTVTLSANWAVGFVPPRANCGKRPGSSSESASQFSEAIQPACCQLFPQTPSPNLRSNHNTHFLRIIPQYIFNLCHNVEVRSEVCI
jgi:hypothetical protein